MDDNSKQIGLHEKFLIIRRNSIVRAENGSPSIKEHADGTLSVTFVPEPEVEGYRKLFVISPATDPAALRALEVYAKHCHPSLAEDLSMWIKTIRRRGLDLSRTGSSNLPYTVLGG